MRVRAIYFLCDACSLVRVDERVGALVRLLGVSIYHMKLETKIRRLIAEANPDANARFEVVAFELWGEPEGGYSTNNAFHIAHNADLAEVLESTRARWEIFKVNYLPKARVCDIADTGFDSTLSLEVDCIPFLEIRLA